tara:strand:- start:39703 stop:40419 length:717 start_codon:yes stop_codon:yes gene_type:complete
MIGKIINISRFMVKKVLEILDPSWLEYLQEEFSKEYMASLSKFLNKEKQNGKLIYPPSKEIFKALELCTYKQVKVIILGQDPYHNQGQAHGLAFSVNEQIRIPPSLHNIFKEVNSDLGIAVPEKGCLNKWATQGVLLLNSVMTVQANSPGSHANKGWERFTDKIIENLNKKSHLVFMLWGNYAAQKASLIDKSRHLVLRASHPSPFSAAKGFFGCKHFSRCNDYLKSKNKTAIDWNIN